MIDNHLQVLVGKDEKSQKWYFRAACAEPIAQVLTPLVSDPTFWVLSRGGSRATSFCWAKSTEFGDTILVDRPPQQSPLDFLSLLSLELRSQSGQRKCSRKTAVSQPKRNNWPEKYSERYQNWSLCSNCSLLLRYFLLAPQVSALIRKRTSNDTSLTTSAENFHLLSPKPDSFCYNSSEKQDLPWLHQVFRGLLEGFPSLIWHSRDPTK